MEKKMDYKPLSEKQLIIANQNIKEKEYWKKKLSGELERSHFPYDFKIEDQKKAGSELHIHRFTLNSQLFSKLLEISNQSDNRLHIILVTGLMGLLEKYTGEKEVLIGQPIARQKKEGEFINTVLALRNQVETERSFKENVMKVGKTIFEATENQNYPLEALILGLNLPFSENGGFPLFEVAILLENQHDRTYMDTTRTHMMFIFNRREDGLEGIVEYNPGLYRSETINEIMLHFEHLLLQMVTEPDKKLSELIVLLEEEKRKLLEEFNQTKADYPWEKGLHQLFEQQMRRTPQNQAVTCNINLYEILEKVGKKEADAASILKMEDCIFIRNPYLFPINHHYLIHEDYRKDIPELEDTILMRTHRQNWVAVSKKTGILLDQMTENHNLNSLFESLTKLKEPLMFYPLEEQEHTGYLKPLKEEYHVGQDFCSFLIFIKRLCDLNLITYKGYQPDTGRIWINWEQNLEIPLAMKKQETGIKKSDEKDTEKPRVLLLGDTPGTASTGILYLASYLRRNGIEAYCQWNDQEKRKDCLQERVLELLSEIEPGIVGISLKWFPHIARVLEMTRVIKEYDTNIKVVLGGNTASYYSEKLIREPSVDVVVMGDGEEPFLKICQGEETIPNSIYIKKGKIEKNPLDYVQDETSIKEIYLSHMDKIFVSEKDPYLASVFYINTGKGCSQQCFYCAGCREVQKKTFNRVKPFLRSSGEVRQDITEAMPYTTTFMFDFDLPQYDSMEYYREIWGGLPLSMHFCYFYFWKIPSVEFIDLVNNTFKYVTINIDLCSLSEVHRKKLNQEKMVKPQPMDDELIALFDHCETYENVEVVINLISGLPYFNREDIKRSNDFLDRLVTQYTCFRGMDWGRLHAQPGAPILQTCDDYDMVSYAHTYEDFYKYSELNFREEIYPNLETIQYPYIYFKDDPLNSEISKFYVDTNNIVGLHKKKNQEKLVKSETLTYEQLNQKANQLARSLQEKGIKRNDVVCLVCEPSIEMAIAVLGVLKAGAAWLPIDPKTPEKRIQLMLKDIQPFIVITEKETRKLNLKKLVDTISEKSEVQVTNPRTPIKDFNSLPTPDRSLLDYEKYGQFTGLSMAKNSFALQATRGCPYNCAYCHKIWPKKHVYRSAENIFQEVESLYKMGVRRFVFVDDIFNLNKENSSKFFNMVIKNKLDIQLFFSAGLRGDILTKDYIDLMIEAGTRNFALALETASPRLQKLIGKNLKLDKFRENIEYICHQHPGLILELFTMHGFPTETEEEAMQTLKFVQDMKWIHFPYIAVLRIYPNTEMERIAMEHGISREAIHRSSNLAVHQLSETIPFDHSFSTRYRSQFINEYFLSKERLLHVLPYQMDFLSEDEILRKYNAYLPVENRSFSELLNFLNIKEEEINRDIKTFRQKEDIRPSGLNLRLKDYYAAEEPETTALRILLLDLSQVFSEEKWQLNIFGDAPLGLLYLMTYLKQEFGTRVTGKLAKSRVDFDNYTQFRKLIEDYKPDLIGIRTLSNYKDFFHEALEKIRQWGIQAPIIAGGPYATSAYPSILQDTNVDLIVIGEGEITFAEVVGKILDNHKQIPTDEVLREINGLAFVPKQAAKKKSKKIEVLQVNELLNTSDLQNSLTEVDIRPEDIAYIIFTSGSTGNPKAVAVQHQNATNTIAFRKKEYQMASNDTSLQLFSFSFDGFITSFFTPIVSGARIQLINENEINDISALREIIRHKRVTHFISIPQLYHTILQETDPRYLKSLKVVTLAGDRIYPEVNELSQNKAPHIEIANEYGVTEAAVLSTIYRNQQNQAQVRIGRPISNTILYVLNPQGKLLPIGVPGELCISGKGVAAGYLNNSELTHQKFTESTEDTGTRLYKTGDQVRWHQDGTIEYLGRIDNQVKLRGFRIELEEIERKLLNHKQVKRAAVLVRKAEEGEIEETRKDTGAYLCAYYILKGELKEAQLREYLIRELPGYMIPSFFVPLKEFPLLPSGKLNRQAFPEPATVLAEIEEQYTAPRNEKEKRISEIWESVLGRKKIGVHDNFFRIGGDSIKSLQIVSRMTQTGYRIKVKDLFDCQTIAKLAPLVEEKSDLQRDQKEVKGEVALTPIQHWFFGKQFENEHHFNQSVLLFSKEGFKKEAVETVFKKLQHHHDAIRMTFKKEEQGIHQYNHGTDHPVSVDEYDFRKLEIKETRLKLNDTLNQIQASIHLEEGPLMKLGLFHLEDGDRLLVIVHHLVMDGVSWRILFEDIEKLNQQYAKKEELALPPKTDSYQRWSEKLSEYANSEEFLKEAEYWTTLQTTPIRFIKKDNPEGQSQMGHTHSISTDLGEDHTELLLTRVNHAFGTEINDILLTALALGIRNQFGNQKTMVGLESHGREEIFEDIDINRTIGWFTCDYPVLLDVTYGRDISYYLKANKEQLRQIPNKGIGYGIFRYLTSDTNKKGVDFRLKPQISFNYLGQFDADMEQKSFGMARESAGNPMGILGQREYELDVTGIIAHKKLAISVTYSNEQYKKETLQALLDQYKRELINLIEYCAKRKKREFTPNDFTYKKLPLEKVDQITKQYPVQDIYLLSPMQEAMLFNTLYDAESSAYFEQISFRLLGELEVPQVKNSLKELFKQHDILRTIYIYQDIDQPIQVILESQKIGFHYQEEFNVPEGENKETYISRLIQGDRDQAFDLGKGPLMRVFILKIQEKEFEFIWSFHHIVMDGWSAGILISQFFEIYHSYLENRQYQLPVIRPYKTYIQWLEKQDKQESLKFWQDYLGDYEEATEVPRSFRHQDTEGKYNLKRYLHHFEKQTTQELNHRAASNQVTLNTIMQVLWGIILCRYNDRKDVVFGTVVSGRSSEIQGIETMIGLFINTVPVRLRYQPGTSFNELVKRTQEEVISTEVHHYYPLAEIQSASHLKQELLNHILVFENYPIAKQVDEGVRETKEPPSQKAPAQRKQRRGFELVKVEAFEQTNYQFNLTIVPGEQLSIRLDYNENCYDTDFIESIAQHFQHIIDQVLQRENLLVEELKLLSSSQAEKLLEDLNQTDREYPKQVTLNQEFDQQVMKNPTQVAVALQESQSTYQELDDGATHLGIILREKGVSRNTIVGIMTEESLEMLVGIFSILKAGGAYLPIDPGYPKDRITLMLKDTHTPMVLWKNQEQDKNSYNTEIIDLEMEKIQELSIAETQLTHINHPGDLAYLIYTSGSTGTPKAVMVKHGNVRNLVLGLHDRIYKQYGTQLRVSLMAPYVFDASVQQIFAVSLQGHTLDIVPPEARRDGAGLIQYYNKKRIDISDGTPAHIYMLSESLTDEALNFRVRHFIIGGEALPQKVVKSLLTKLNPKEVKITNIYGPAECCVDVISYEVTRENVDDYPLVPLGTPMPNQKIYILDPGNRIKPIGIPGELCISGHGVSRGYLNHEELTDDKFIDNPFDPGQRLYRTGDLARWMTDGKIEFLGRIDHQVKIRGFRIELGEIENQLNKHPEIKESLVMTKTNDAGENFLCAYILSEKEFTLEVLREHLVKQLPNYMVPTHFVTLRKFPITHSGKTDRRALPDPEEAGLQSGTEFVAPRNHMEEMLLEIWEKVLGRKNLGIQDNFFMNGGDSIKSIQIAARMNKAGYKVGVKDIFQNPTVAELAPKVRKIKHLADQSVITGEIPLTPIQKSFLESRRMPPLYFNQVFMLFSKEGFDEQCVKTIFSKLQEHHDALRIVYPQKEGQITQLNLGLELPVSLHSQDLRNQEQVRDKIRDTVITLYKTMDPGEGPLVKLAIFHMADGDRLILIINHLVMDGISWRILLEDIETLYHQYQKTEKLELPLKSDSFKLWARGLLEYSNSSAFLEEKAYWAAVEAQAIPPLKRDFHHPMNETRDAISTFIELEESETELLITKVHLPFGTEINDILLCALGLGLKRAFGYQKFLVALEGHGREEVLTDVDITRTVGWFTTEYPVILDVSKHQDLSELIKETKEGLRQLPNKGIGHGILKYLTSAELQQGIEFKQKPQISFNYLGQFETSGEQGIIQVESVPLGDGIFLEGQREYELDMVGMITGKRLKMTVTYNKKQYKEETLHALLTHFKEELKGIISFCTTRKEKQLTPSDMTYKGLSVEDMDSINALFE
jgi:amino acid adenylation domain-containing protein/non-ribosomal peptide synthase protein (TIGR01720 family)